VAGLPAAALAALAGALAWRSRGWPLVHDAPLMHYIAWRISEGAVPYRDLFDMNVPGVYLVHRGVLAVFGAGDAGFRAFDLLWLGLGAVAIGALASRWGAEAALGSGALFASAHLAAGPWNAGQRDFLLCPFLVAGALGVARFIEAPRRRGALALAGLALGAGVTIKPHAVVLVLALAALVAMAARHAGDTALFLALAALPPVAVVAWVAWLGGLGAWREIVVEYLGPLYSGLGRPARWGFHRAEVWLPVVAAAVASLASAAVARRLGPRHLVAAVGSLYGLVHYAGQGKGWEYHAYPFAAFAAPLAFAELAPLARRRRWLAALPLAAALLVATGLLAAKGVEASGAGWIRDTVHRVDGLVAQMRPFLRDGDTVQVLDTTGGGIHALLRLRVAQPTRFVYDFHFFHDVGSPVIERLRAELVRDLAARPPRLVVLFDRGWPAGGAERLASFPALARWLDGWRPVARGDGYVILHAQPGRP
jgi:hypothetical protein